MLAKSPRAIVQIFTCLCLSQVKEQLIENLVYTGRNPVSFILNNELYTFIQNDSLILDVSFAEFETDLNFHNRYN